MKRPFELLSPHQVAEVRAGLINYGSVARIIVRAITGCNCCGEAIAKGAEALRFYWDFHGRGSYTRSVACIHPDCQPADEATRRRINAKE